MKHYCYEKHELCEFAGLNGYCNQTACTKLYSVTYEAYGMNPLTNADYIRSLGDKELAELLVYKIKCTGCNAENCDEKFCVNLMKEWIEYPYEKQ